VKVKSRLTYLAYIKLCDGYVLIFDPLIKESIQFIEHKLELLARHTSVLNVLLVANIKFTDHSDVYRLKEVSKNFQANDRLVKSICEKYDLRVNYIDVMNLKSFKKTIIKFLSFVYVRKSKPKKKQRNTTTLFKPIEEKEKIPCNFSRRSYSGAIKQEDDNNLCII
jgi:hypothetical protein